MAQPSIWSSRSVKDAVPVARAGAPAEPVSWSDMLTLVSDARYGWMMCSGCTTGERSMVEEMLDRGVSRKRIRGAGKVCVL
jgi:hypothetical protein